MSKSEEFKNLMGGIQALIIAVSVVVAGIWTWKTFDLTLQEENARASVQKLKESLHREAEVIIQIDAQQRKHTHKKTSRYIVGTITITNNGNALANLIFENGPLILHSAHPYWTFF